MDVGDVAATALAGTAPPSANAATAPTANAAHEQEQRHHRTRARFNMTSSPPAIATCLA
jgi:hypothetical protein